MADSFSSASTAARSETFLSWGSACELTDLRLSRPLSTDRHPGLAEDVHQFHDAHVADRLGKRAHVPLVGLRKEDGVQQQGLKPAAVLPLCPVPSARQVDLIGDRVDGDCMMRESAWEPSHSSQQTVAGEIRLAGETGWAL